MKRAVVLTLLIATGTLSVALGARQGPPGGQADQPKVVEVEKVKDNLYMLKGGGGNTAVFVSNAGVVVVDTKLAGWGQPILDKIKTITDKPVTTIINTHTHGDHTGSNEFFGSSVEFVAQENTETNMEKMDAFKGEKAAFLPKKTFKDKLSLMRGKDQIDVYYFGSGHTNGDAWIVFTDARVVHAGDIFSGKNLPIIDVKNGGSAAAYPRTLAKAWNGLKNVDTIITGHSTTLPFADLKEYAAFNQEFLTWAQGESKAGKSVDEAVAEFKPSSPYASYTLQPERLKANVQTVYDESKK
jgi:glyoxylase-like metal-dependent hydrolase (beta-lactamase superfamily II)